MPNDHSVLLSTRRIRGRGAPALGALSPQAMAALSASRLAALQPTSRSGP